MLIGRSARSGNRVMVKSTESRYLRCDEIVMKLRQVSVCKIMTRLCPVNWGHTCEKHECHECHDSMAFCLHNLHRSPVLAEPFP